MRKTAVAPTQAPRSLDAALASLEQAWAAKANRLEHKRRSCNDYTPWKARGGQEALRRAAHHLYVMRRECCKPRALRVTLSGYLHCLEKSCGDAREESLRSLPKRGIPAFQWKAEGELRALQGMCTNLEHVLADFS